MIYFDNASTTLKKPSEVAEAVAYAINNFGNMGRSFCTPSLLAAREIYNTRTEIARLVGLDEPLNIAFTSSATESMNLVVGGLIKSGDLVATTEWEHNSTLRPLYLSGCQLYFIDPHNPQFKADTKFLVCTHGSNLTGDIVDAARLYQTCKEQGITMILDVAQTLGSIPVTMDMADIFCFTGHKGLFGPQGTGGIIINREFDFDIVKTGGAGVHTFQAFQSKEMPDIFEVGTPNSHGIFGLQKGVAFVNQTGVEKIHNHEAALASLFYDGIKHFDKVQFYGNMEARPRLPIISLNIKGLDSAELAERLWEGYGIATRSGGHCAPLLHQLLGTEDVGVVRFSFSYFNTKAEVQQAISAMKEISK
ncbi:MAG: aminotransferase class V-fold PLP-dependent enzyme [Defluviitaleaceae bacterium]|nr:aminotransferase class V-fold PLP-dependent enzyme [Defluviitaleaceae bacterium]